MLAISMIKKMLDAGMSEEDIEAINSQTIPHEQENHEEVPPKDDPKLEEQPEKNTDPVHYLSESLFCSNKSE